MSDPTSDEIRALKSILRAAVEALGLEFDETPASPLRLSASVVREDELDAAVFKVRIPLYALRDLKRKAADARSVAAVVSSRTAPANVAAFVLKAPALDRLLLVMSNKKGRAWELPGGAIEPGETPADAAGREVVEEAGIYFRAEGGGWTVEGCEVFRGTSHAGLVVPGGDVTSARWFTPDEARPLKLSDLPTAKLIREWVERR